MSDSNSEFNFDSLRLNNRAECFRVIKTRALMETLSHQSCFITRDRAIRVSFDTKNPLVANDIIM